MGKCVVCGKRITGNSSICQQCINNVFKVQHNANKYKATKTQIDGITFDSKLEANRYQYLKLLEKAGEIKGLEWHKRFIIIPKSSFGEDVYYEADFFYFEKDKPVVEDTKSTITIMPLYKLKKRLLAETHGIIVKEVYRDEV